MSWKVGTRVHGTPVYADLEVQQGLVPVVAAHFSDFLAGLDLLTFTHQPYTVVRVGTEHSITVLDNDQFTKANQPVTAVHHGTRSTGDDGLTLPAGDIQAISRRIIAYESTQYSALDRPLPGLRIRTGRSRF